MQKNVASQKWIVFAFDVTTNLPKTGDASNITAKISLDGGTLNTTTTAHPSELEKGYYYFPLTQGETNGGMILISPASATSNIQVIGVPGVVWTEPSGQKYPATLAYTDVSGNLPAEVVVQDNIDFGALQKASLNAATPTVSVSLSGDFTSDMKTSLNAATPASIQDIPADGSGFTALETAIKTEMEAPGSTLALIKAKTDTIGGGSGLITWTYLLTEPPENTGIPIVGAEIWVTSDSAGTNVLATGTTNVSGIATFLLSAGTVYVWRAKDGYSFINPDQETVS